MKSTMKAAYAISAGLLFGSLSRTASAQSATGGFCIASAPVYSDGTLSASAYGDLWSVGPSQAYYKVTLTIDGAIVWSNSGGKGLGVELPFSDPGYVFDFEPSISGLASGWHIATWTGSASPNGIGVIDVGDFSFTTEFEVP